MNIFITGASSGIGAALARELAARGATIGLCARRADELEKLRQSLPRPEEHRCYAVDVTDREALLDAIDDFDSLPDGTEIAIACAGMSVGCQTEYYEDLDVQRKVFELNLFATATTFHGFIGPMKDRGRGTLVGIASAGGVRGLPGHEAYGPSKAAVISYCESLRVGLKKDGVKVVTLCPGYVRTPLTAGDPFSKPFMLDADDFARRAVKQILAGTSYAVIPWQMWGLTWILKLLPDALFDRILGKRERKPRANQQ